MNRSIQAGLCLLGFAAFGACTSGKPGASSTTPSHSNPDQVSESGSGGSGLQATKPAEPNFIARIWESACEPVAGSNHHLRERLIFQPRTERGGDLYSNLEFYASSDCNSEDLILLDDLKSEYHLTANGELVLLLKSQIRSFHRSTELERSNREGACEIDDWRLQLPRDVTRSGCSLARSESPYNPHLKNQARAAQDGMLVIESCPRTENPSPCLKKVYLEASS